MKNIINKIKEIITIPYVDLTHFRGNEYNMIKDLVLDGIENGAYDKSFAKDVNSFASHVATNRAITDIHKREVISLSCSFVRSRLKYIFSPKEMISIGYITLAIDKKKQNIEIWHFSILPEFKNKGLGKVYLQILFQIINREYKQMDIIARCHKDNSKAMQHILDNEGFKLVSQNREGYNLLIKPFL